MVPEIRIVLENKTSENIKTRMKIGQRHAGKMEPTERAPNGPN